MQGGEIDIFGHEVIMYRQLEMSMKKQYEIILENKKRMINLKTEDN